MVSDTVIDKLRFGIKNSMNLSFAGCGFLGIYHVGVASCIREYAPHLAADKVAGASAGAIAAVGLVCNADLGEATTQVLQVALKARSFTLGPLHPTFSIVDFVKGLLDDFLPFNAHKLCNGRVHISLTRMSDRKNVIVNQFDSREDLIQALICSAYIPFYCGLIPPKYKGTYYLDGGLSDNIPILDDETITVSPFAGESDICPSDGSGSYMHVHLANTSLQVSTSNLYRFGCIVFPPSPETLSKMCQQGFDDCLTFLQKNNLISCARHLSIYSSITSAQPFDSTTRVPSTTQTNENEESIFHQTEQALRSTAVVNNDSQVDGTVSFDLDSSGDSISTSSSLTSLESWCSEEDVSHFCEECAQRRTLAVPESLPTPVVIALQAACESVNSGIYGYMRSMRAFRALSLIAAPAYLPMEIAYSVVRRFADWVPYMPADMQWFAQELLAMLRDTYDFVQASRHRYSARFTCQLAITELECKQDGSSEAGQRIIPNINLATRPHTLPPNARRHLNVGFSLDIESKGAGPLEYVDKVRHRILEGDEEVHIHSLPPTEVVELDSDAILASPTSSGISTPNALEFRSRASSASRPRSASMSTSSKTHTSGPRRSSGSGTQKRLNVDNTSALDLSSSCHHDVLSETGSNDITAVTGNKTSDHSHKKNHHHYHHHHHRNSKHQTIPQRKVTTDIQADSKQPGADSTFDTFENCLHIVEQMDSILSYYYSEEDNPNVIRVAEIYPLNDPSAPHNAVESLTSEKEHQMRFNSGMRNEKPVSLPDVP